MDFIDNIDFVLPFGWSDNGFFAQIANVVDARIAGGINLDNIEIIIFKRVVKMVNFVRKNTSNRSFAGATRADKKISMGNSTSFDGIGQNIRDLFLPNDC